MKIRFCANFKKESFFLPKFTQKITTAANGSRLFTMPRKTDSFAFSDRLVHCFFQCSKLYFPTIPPDIFFPKKKRASPFNGDMKRGSAEKKGSHLCGVAKFKPSGESHGDFFKVKKKASPESYFSPSFSFSLFPLYPSKNAKILSIVTYVTPGLERDYHHSIAFIVLHFLRVLYLAPFLMTLSQREKGKRDI